MMAILTARSRRITYAILAVVLSVGLDLVSGSQAEADAPSVSYTYDVQGRIIQAMYSNGIVVTYGYDVNGNIQTQAVTVLTQPLCLKTSAHGNPTTWGAGLLSAAGAGC